MDSRPAPERRRELRLARGVTVRTFKTERRFQIAFSFRGVECRELLPPQSITQTSADLAGGLRAEILRRIAEGTFRYADYFPTSSRAARFGAAAGLRVRVRDRLDAQLEHYRRQVENGTLARSTLIGYEKAITGERMRHWDTYQLDEVTPSALRDWVGALGITAKAARNLLTPLRSLFEDAVNDELIPFNPFDRIALGKLLRQTTKASDYEVDPFTANERELLLAAARPDEAPMLRFWLATGLRPGELIALRWDRIDWPRRMARIDVNQVAGVQKGPKTAAGVRDIELVDDALAALIAQKPLSLAAGAEIWTNPRTGRAWSTDAQIRKTLWVPLCERAGVRYRNPYQVRHTYASALLTDGANPFWLAEQLGHVDVEMVFRTYGRFIREDWKKPRATNHLQVVK